MNDYSSQHYVHCVHSCIYLIIYISVRDVTRWCWEKTDLCMWKTWTLQHSAPPFLARLTPGGHLENKEKETEKDEREVEIRNSAHEPQVQQECLTCSCHRNHTKPQAAQKTVFASRRDERVQGDFYKPPPNHFNQASQPGTSSTYKKSEEKKRTQDRLSFDLSFLFIYIRDLHCISISRRNPLRMNLHPLVASFICMNCPCYFSMHSTNLNTCVEHELLQNVLSSSFPFNESEWLPPVVQKWQYPNNNLYCYNKINMWICIEKDMGQN